MPSLTRILAETTTTSLQTIHENKKLLFTNEHHSSKSIQDSHSDIAHKHYDSAILAIIVMVVGGLSAMFANEAWKAAIPTLIPLADKCGSSAIQGLQQVQSGIITEEQNLLQQHQEDRKFCSSMEEMAFNSLKDISRQESQEVQG
jgi:uncharacterized protein YjeT (DUF2065 family)